MAVNGIIGIKLGMTQIFQDDGTAVDKIVQVLVEAKVL